MKNSGKESDFPDPLDQYIVEHPDNLEILVIHLKCAAFELPVKDGGEVRAA